jgi:sporulation related protein
MEDATQSVPSGVSTSLLNKRDWQFVVAFSLLALLGVSSGVAYVVTRRTAAEITPSVVAAEPTPKSDTTPSAPSQPAMTASIPAPTPIPAQSPIVAPPPAPPSIPVRQQDLAEPHKTSSPPAAKPETPSQPMLPKPVAAPVLTIPVSAPAPPSGSLYLQIAAGTRRGADELLEKVKTEGFTGRVVVGPNDWTFRVLIGPAADASLLAELKREVDSAGYVNFIRKYDETYQQESRP